LPLGGQHNGYCLMKETDLIREQIRRMRRNDVEPEFVYVCTELYLKLETENIGGVPIELDDRLKTRFEVR